MSALTCEDGMLSAIERLSAIVCLAEHRAARPPRNDTSQSSWRALIGWAENPHITGTRSRGTCPLIERRELACSLFGGERRW